MTNISNIKIKGSISGINLVSENEIVKYIQTNYSRLDTKIDSKQDKGDYALKTDLPTDFYSKSYIDSSYNSLDTKIDSSYNSLDTKIDSKQDKGDYALKTDLPTDFYSKSYIDSSYNSLNTKIDSKQDKLKNPVISNMSDTKVWIGNKSDFDKITSKDDKSIYLIIEE